MHDVQGLERLSGVPASWLLNLEAPLYRLPPWSSTNIFRLDNRLIDLVNLSDQELEVFQQQFERLRKRGNSQPQTRQTP